MNESKLSDEALAELLTLTMGVDEYGDVEYRNHLGQLHRIHGPAVIYEGGSMEWWQHGQLHRTDGPAVIYSGGAKAWFLDDQELTQTEFNERTKSLR